MVPFVFLPVTLPICVWVIRTFSADARGHGTEAVIAAVHQRSGRVDWLVAPVKLSATVMTLAFGGSVGKEGPAAQIGAALTSLFALWGARSIAARTAPLWNGPGARVLVNGLLDVTPLG